MKGPQLKSSSFRREREKGWQELEALLVRAEKKGLSSLTSTELLRLPNLYRATLSALSVSRGISLDLNLKLYLESLCTRAYFQIYGARESARGAIVNFILSGFPALVRRAKWHILVSFLCLFMGTVTGFSLTMQNQDWYYSFAGQDDRRSPASSTEDLRDILYNGAENDSEKLSFFATFLFTHNAKIGMLAFALGFVLGLPTLYLVFQNGLMLGAFTALYTSRGLGVDIWGWLLIHGVTELLAVVLCGAGGLMLASALIFPGKHARLENLAIKGREAGLIILGCVGLFFIAGLLEGFARQMITDMPTRYMVAGLSGIFWLAYFVFAGRGRGDVEKS